MSDGQEMTRSIFDTENEDGVRSPEKLNEYIRVTSPGIWMAVVALLLILVSIIVWGLTGRIPVYHSTSAVGMRLKFDASRADLGSMEDYAVEGVLCFMEATDVSSHELQEKRANVVFRDGTRVEGISYLLDTTPEKDEEIKGLLSDFNIDSDWVLSILGDGVYRYPVYIELEKPLDYLYWGEIAEAAVIVKEVRPIYFLIGEENEG